MVDTEVKNLRDFAVLGEPIVGTEMVVLDERGQGALSPRLLPSPKEPTPAARAIHNLTHALRSMVSILRGLPASE